ncbi:MAG: hypothetical protein KDD45_14200 [Bdellovibrionales bacterium]|nr:hypothetical protein [Bdellovibrionales bacterium]
MNFIKEKLKDISTPQLAEGSRPEKEHFISLGIESIQQKMEDIDLLCD